MERLKKLYQKMHDQLEKWPWSKKFGVRRVEWGILGGIILMLLIVVLSAIRSRSKDAGVYWAVARQGDFVVSLIESGDVEAFSQYSINAPMMWGASNLQVIELVPEGTIVKKGDFLLQFDVSDLEDQKKLREDQLESFFADMDKLKAQQSLTISNLESQRRLSEYSYEQSQLRLEMRKYESEAQQEQARLDLKQAEIDLKRIRTQIESQHIIQRSQIIQREMTIREASNDLKSTIERIDRLQLKAPTDGMVVYQQVRGERVKEGYQARPGWPLMSIPDLSRMQVKIFLNEVDQTKIRSGLDATLVLDAYPEQEFHGKVREIARLAQTVTGEELLKGFICYVDIDGTDPRLKPGISAKVNIILDRMEDVVSVPVGAVYEIDGQYVVYEQGRQKPTEIEVGPRNDGFIVVNNLEPGTRMSWIPYTNAQMLGWHEEQKRIAEVYQKIQQSFVIFADRGILFDYGVDQAGASEQETSQSPGVDLDKLPAAIRDRLQSQNTGETGTEPNIVVESPEGRTRDGTFRVSPNMLERLNRSTDTRRDTSSAQR